MYTSSYLTLRQKRSTKIVSTARPLPSQLIRIAAALSRLVNSVLVNCTPWSVLNISGVADSQSPIQRFQAKTGIQGDRDVPRQDVATEPIDHRHQIDEASLEADVGDVTTPDLIAALDAHSSQQIRIALSTRPGRLVLGLG